MGEAPAHEGEQGMLHEEASPGHRREPRRLGHGEQVRVQVENGIVERHPGFLPRRARPGQLPPRREEGVAGDRDAVEEDPARADAVEPVAFSGSRVATREIFEERDAGGVMAQAQAVFVPPVSGAHDGELTRCSLSAR